MVIAVLAVGEDARKDSLLAMLATLRGNGGWRGRVQIVTTEDGAECLQLLARADNRAKLGGLELIVVPDPLDIPVSAGTPIFESHRARTMTRKSWKTRLPELAIASWERLRASSIGRQLGSAHNRDPPRPVATVYLDSDIVVGQRIHPWIEAAILDPQCQSADICGFPQPRQPAYPWESLHTGVLLMWASQGTHGMDAPPRSPLPLSVPSAAGDAIGGRTSRAGTL